MPKVSHQKKKKNAKGTYLPLLAVTSSRLAYNFELPINNMVFPH